MDFVLSKKNYRTDYGIAALGSLAAAQLQAKQIIILRMNEEDEVVIDDPSRYVDLTTLTKDQVAQIGVVLGWEDQKILELLNLLESSP